MFDTRRVRPFRLSNRNCCYSDEEMRRIGVTPPQQLCWSDFKALFPISLCTASYEEQLFYLPLALAYLENAPDDGAECLAELVYFVSHYGNELERDELLLPAKDGLWACFRTWTLSFEVVHFDREACRAKGWRLEYFDYVSNSQSVHELLDDLWRFERQRETAEAMVESWVRPDRRAIDAAWLLESARELRESGAHDIAQSSRATAVLSDADSLRSAYEEARASGIVSGRATYWADLVETLGLIP